MRRDRRRRRPRRPRRGGGLHGLRGLNAIILEKSDAVGAVWRRHYDRLHLHTDRAHSGLPGLPMPSALRPLSLARSGGRIPRGLRGEVRSEACLQHAVSAVRRDGRVWRAEAGTRRPRRPSSSSRPAGPTIPYARPGPAWRRSAARSCIRAAIAIPRPSQASACSSSASAIRAPRSRSISPKPGST